MIDVISGDDSSTSHKIRIQDKLPIYTSLFLIIFFIFYHLKIFSKSLISPQFLSQADT